MKERYVACVIAKERLLNRSLPCRQAPEIRSRLQKVARLHMPVLIVVLFCFVLKGVHIYVKPAVESWVPGVLLTFPVQTSPETCLS